MKLKNRIPTAIFVAGIVCNPLVWSRAFAEEAVKVDDGKMVAAQEGDSRGPQPRADKLSRKDGEITRQIRRSLKRDDQLSTAAKNVRVVTSNGRVTLRGPVTSEAELQAVLRSANSAVGAARVQNELTVSPDSVENMPGSEGMSPRVDPGSTY